MADDQDQAGQHDQARTGTGPAVQGKSRDTAVTTVATSTSVTAAATSIAGLIGSPDDAAAFYPPGTEP